MIDVGFDRKTERRLRDVERNVPVSPLKFGGDPTGVVAADAAIQAALDTGKGVDLGGPENVWKLATGVTRTADTVILGRGATLDMSAIAVGAGSGKKSAIRVLGSAGAKVLLTSNAVKRNRSITVADASGFAVNDWVEVASDGPRTTLSVAIPDAVSTANITVADASNFDASGMVVVDDESISYTSRAGNVLSGITRAANGTVAASHSSGTTVFNSSAAAYFPAHGTNPASDRGEKKQIHTIVGTTITFRQSLYDDYSTTYGAFIRKLTMPSVRAEGFRVVSDDDPGTDAEYGLYLQWCNGVKVDIDTSNLNSMGIWVNGCIRGQVRGATFRGPDTFAPDTVVTNTYYGVGLYNGTQWFRVYGCHAEHLRRLGVTSSSGAGQDYYGCPRFVVVSTCTGQNLRVQMWEHHGFGEKIRVENISCDGCDGLVQIEGPGITVDGGQVSNWRQYAIALSFDIVNASDVTIRDIDIWQRSSDASSSARAVFCRLDNATTIKDVWLEDIRIHEFDVPDWPAMDVDGTATAVNSGFRNCSINCIGTRTSYAVELNPPGWVMEGGGIVASGFGVRMNADSQRVRRVDFQLSDPATGHAVLMMSSNQRVTDCTGDVAFNFASINNTSTANWTIAGNKVKVPLNSRAINNPSFVAGFALNNSWQLASGDFSVVSASSLSLTCMGNLYWRVTGTTAIDNIVKMSDGTVIWIEATGALPINHNTAAPPATHGAVKLNSGANITLATDKVIALACRAGTWRQVAVA